MIKGILGNKIKQTQTFDESGKRLPVTLISTGPCHVVAVKLKEKDGYNSLLLGLGSRRAKTISKPELGVLKKAGLDKNPPRFLKEIEFDGVLDESLKPGLPIKINEIFQVGDKIQITGVSRGLGFAGPVKRHHFKGGPRTHGQSDRERSPGSIGSTTTPGRVYKGKRMAGRMGSDKVTVKGLKVISIDSEKEIMTVSGLVPGFRGNILTISKQI